VSSSTFRDAKLPRPAFPLKQTNPRKVFDSDRSGRPLGSILAACNLPNAGTCYADSNPNVSGPVRNTARTLAHGLRNPSSFNQDLSVRRDFPISRVRLGIGFDVFNVCSTTSCSRASRPTSRMLRLEF
jgi:hypothetical protein